MPAQEVMIPADEAGKKLGLKNRQIQLLAKQGRLRKYSLPRQPGAGGKQPVCYTLQSVEDEMRRRAEGVRVASPIMNAPPISTFTPEASGETLPILAATTAQIDGWKALTGFLQGLTQSASTRNADPSDYTDDSYLTITECAAIKRMSTSWIEEQIAAGRLPFETTKRGGKRVLRGDLRRLESRRTR